MLSLSPVGRRPMDTYNIDGLRFPTRSENVLSGEEYSSGQEHLLPIANVGRIMKMVLPAHAMISKEARETMQECASEFISFVTVEAASSCRRNNRKTVSGDDMCSAMRTLGLDNYADTIGRFLSRYKEQEGIRAADRGEVGSRNDNGAYTRIDLVDELSISKSRSSTRHRRSP